MNEPFQLLTFSRLSNHTRYCNSLSFIKPNKIYYLSCLIPHDHAIKILALSFHSKHIHLKKVVSSCRVSYCLAKFLQNNNKSLLKL